MSMGAFDEILKNTGEQFMLQSKKALVSPRGSILSGKLSEYMDVKAKAKNRIHQMMMLDDDEEVDDSEPIDSSTQLGRIFVRKAGSSTMDYGFVFNKDGTERAIKDISVGDGKLRIYENYRDKFLFIDDNKKELWSRATNQRSLIASDIEYMMRKTDVQYRTHGDRLHYLVIGKVIIYYQNGFGMADRMVFPLFLFSCIGERKEICKTLTIEVEQAGFFNFSFDENYLDSEISKIINSSEVVMDDKFPQLLTEIQEKIPKKQYLKIDKIEVDPTFSMIGIVTGFETEYLDRAWEKITQ